MKRDIIVSSLVYFSIMGLWIWWGLTHAYPS
jgi:hypothetical protein